MKTDDYKQELRLSATLHGRNAKKNIFAFKKISKSPEKFCDFFRVLAESRENIGAPNCAEKMALRLKGRLNRLTTLL
jgi:hypothetical protein